MARLIGAFVALVLLFAILALSVYQMWGAAGLFGVLATGIVCLFLLRFLAGRMLRKAFEAPFAAKGAVLQDARMVVHSVTPTAAPPDLDEDEDEEEELSAGPRPPRAWYLVELTISPGPAIGPFQLWEPGELVLTGPEARTSRDLDSLEEGGKFELREVRIAEGEEWPEDDGSKYAGEQRLRLLIAAPVAARQARLRYYFEVFGQIDLPGPE